MGQLLRIIIILGGVWLIVHLVRQALARRREAGRPPAIDKMVPCAHCGVHVPESRAVHAGGKTYCCEEHRAAERKH